MKPEKYVYFSPLWKLDERWAGGIPTPAQLRQIKRLQADERLRLASAIEFEAQVLNAHQITLEVAALKHRLAAQAEQCLAATCPP